MIFLYNLVKKIPYEYKLIFLAFFITRSILTVAGVHSRVSAPEPVRKWYVWNYSDNLWLDVWSVWDSGWYLDIAQNGYSTTLKSDLPKRICCGQNNFGFFPLYPLTIRLFGNIIGNYHTAGILLSNIFLIISSLILYKLVVRVQNKKTAILSVWVLFAFPTSIILSGIFSESLFLLLLLLCFYFALQGKWFASGISGYFLALTRPTGFLVIVPLAFEFFHNNKKEAKSVLNLLLIPLGLLSFMLFTYFKTGDLLYYFHLKNLAWGYRMVNPIKTITDLLSLKSDVFVIIGTFVIVETVLVVLAATRKEFSFFILSIILISAALVNGTEVAVGIPRMSSVIFPVFLYIAKTISKINIYLKVFSILTLLSLEIVFMYYFSNGLLII